MEQEPKDLTGSERKVNWPEPKEDLAYWKANAEEDYLKVPISVLRYISEIETKYSKLEELCATQKAMNELMRQDFDKLEDENKELVKLLERQSFQMHDSNKFREEIISYKESIIKELQSDNESLRGKVKDAYIEGWKQSESYEWDYLETAWEEWSKENL